MPVVVFQDVLGAAHPVSFMTAPRNDSVWSSTTAERRQHSEASLAAHVGFSRLGSSSLVIILGVVTGSELAVGSRAKVSKLYSMEKGRNYGY